MMKKIIVSVSVLLALLSIYFGAYLPFVKAQLYLETQAHLSDLRTVGEIEEAFDKAFDFKSPIGEVETVKFFVELVQNIVSSGQVSEVVQRELAAYAESKINQSDVVHLVQMGNTYDMLWREFGGSEYFGKAESYYQKVLDIGPRLPQALYSLFNLYGTAGDVVKLKDISRRILAIWPNDARVQGVLDTVGDNE